MQVIRKEAEKEPVSSLGARVGDQIIFSSHHPRNIKSERHMSDCDVEFDKLYEVVKVEDNGRSYIDLGKGIGPQAWGCHDYHSVGYFDIIVKAPAKEPEFQHLTLVLENQDEVDLIANLIGETNQTLIGKKLPNVDSMALYRAIEKHAVKNVNLRDMVNV